MVLIVTVGESTDDDEVNNDDSVNIRPGMWVPHYNSNNEIERWGWIEDIVRGQPGGTKYIVRFDNQDYLEYGKQHIQGKYDLLRLHVVNCVVYLIFHLSKYGLL
jgi:hypothetical protein